MTQIIDRVRCKALHSKIVSAHEAAAAIKDGMNVGTSGFTSSGYPKAVPLALAERVRDGENIRINLWTGASVGAELDGVLAEAGAIARRVPFQSDIILRKAINTGVVDYTDIHLSQVAQQACHGFLGGKTDVAIVEACAITEEGHIIPTMSVGNSPSFVRDADIVIVEINTTQSPELEGMHDIYVVQDPPFRQPIPIVGVGDRIGTPYIPAGPDKITYIVPCEIPDRVRPLVPINDDARAMANYVTEFFQAEVKAGRLPAELLPLQSGVGSVANAVLEGLIDSPFENLECFTEVIQDGMFDLVCAGKLAFASGTSITLSKDRLKRFQENMKEYRHKLLIRPQEISNHPEVVRRLGVIAMNTAIEVDIFGHVNSTHILGSRMMNGIGGSGDYARNGQYTIFFTNSVAKEGAISSIVPMCSHIDHTEHDVHVIISERGIADLRGLSPRERARKIISIAHPDYQAMLLEYLERAERETRQAHTPHNLKEALSWHLRFMETGTMKKQ